VINNSYLLGLYSLSPGAGFSLGGSTPGPPVRKSQPTAPWHVGVERAEPSDLVRSALAGRGLINEGAAEVDLSGASADYRKLFTLYQGLNTLTALANRAAESGVRSTEQALLNKRFIAGLAEVGGYAQSADYEDVRVVRGSVTASSKSTAGVAQASTRLTTRPIHEGSLTAPVPAFEGEIAFDITIKKESGDLLVSINLDEMGAEGQDNYPAARAGPVGSRRPGLERRDGRVLGPADF
jgi:hypothetical protein